MGERGGESVLIECTRGCVRGCIDNLHQQNKCLSGMVAILPWVFRKISSKLYKGMIPQASPDSNLLIAASMSRNKHMCM